MGDISALERAIWDTVRYFDLFDMPVTQTQIWQTLITEQQLDIPTPVHSYHVQDIRAALESSSWLQECTGSKWGYVFVRGREHLVRERLRRHGLAQQKWKLARKLARYLSVVPFVQGLAGAGSLALDNTKESSDLDFFIIAKGKRIWMARLGLLVVSQILARRRKYWNVQAPDKLCLNHYVTNMTLLLPESVRNIYTAVAYRVLVPVFSNEALRQFQMENMSWIGSYVSAPPFVSVPYRYEVRTPALLGVVKRFIESFLSEPIGDGMERLAERIQRAVIQRHSVDSRPGRIVLSDNELAFHPDTKVPALLRRFHENVLTS